jgi:hypothetical protein
MRHPLLAQIRHLEGIANTSIGASSCYTTSARASDALPNPRFSPHGHKLTSILFDDYTGLPFEPTTESLKVSRLAEPGSRLDVAYELFRRVFDPAVLDSKSTYVEMLSANAHTLDGFRAICTIASFQAGQSEVIVGMLSSNLMWIDEEAGILQLAIGNVATSPRVKESGFRGVGTALWQQAIDIAHIAASNCQSELAYSVSEAEAESLGFWRKLGYLQPAGLQYLQPPLEFDVAGNPLHEEVPETFLVCPLENRSRQTIDAHLVRQMVLAIYRNWCIETNRRRLSPAALNVAESYVMDRVFPRVDRTIDPSQIALAIPRFD